MQKDEFTDLGLKQRMGALVSQVDKDGPAAKAGIEPGDVIIEFNGKPVPNRDQLIQMVTATKPGSTVPLKVVRDKKDRGLNVTVEELDLATESTGNQSANESGSGQGTSTGFGLKLDNITPEHLPAVTSAGRHDWRGHHGRGPRQRRGRRRSRSVRRHSEGEWTSGLERGGGQPDPLEDPVRRPRDAAGLEDSPGAGAVPHD